MYDTQYSLMVVKHFSGTIEASSATSCHPYLLNIKGWTEINSENIFLPSILVTNFKIKAPLSSKLYLRLASVEGLLLRARHFLKLNSCQSFSSTWTWLLTHWFFWSIWPFRACSAGLHFTKTWSRKILKCSKISCSKFCLPLARSCPTHMAPLDTHQRCDQSTAPSSSFLTAPTKAAWLLPTKSLLEWI